MKFISLYFLILFCFLTITACRHEKISPAHETVKTERIVIPDDLETPTIKKGYYGQVIKWERVLVPDPNLNTPDWGQGKELPVNNEIYIYPSLYLKGLKTAMVKDSFPKYYISKIETEPLYIVTPNNKGYYQIELPKGKYSAFIKADSLTIYINGAGADGQEGPFNMESEALINKNLRFDIELYR